MKKLMNKHFIFVLVAALSLGSCVSKKDFLAMQGNRDALQSTLDKTKKQVADLEAAKDDLEGRVTDLESMVSSQKSELSNKDSQMKSLEQSLEEQLNALKAENELFQTGLTDLSLLSDHELKKLRETLKTMEGTEDKKAAFSKALADNLKKSLGGNTGDITVSSKGSLIYVTLSDKVLFKPGRTGLTDHSSAILSGVAKVLKENSDIDVLVEGHTDSDPISLTTHKDNWDLSIKRALTVVDALRKYDVNPARLIPTGRGEHKPKADNTTKEGKQMNRRTEIILVPRVDQYLRLVTK